ncbi:unnamed protein product, partial [Hapterophycus canaliculatus]
TSRERWVVVGGLNTEWWDVSSYFTNEHVDEFRAIDTFLGNGRGIGEVNKYFEVSRRGPYAGHRATACHTEVFARRGLEKRKSRGGKGILSETNGLTKIEP